MIELADPHQIALLRLKWQIEQDQRYTKPEYEREIEQMSQYAESRQLELQRIADEYKASEEKRIAKRGARKKSKEAEENERWDRIFKEKFEDESYYAR